MLPQAQSRDDNALSPLVEVLGISTRLGLTSFGGPIAHLGYYREEYVVRRRSLAPDRPRVSLAIVAATVALASRTAGAQVVVIVVAGLVGWLLLPAAGASATTAMRIPIGRGLAVGSLALFFVLLVGLPIARQ